nr:unnamed protein product [Callosobruchus analis]
MLKKQSSTRYYQQPE